MLKRWLSKQVPDIALKNKKMAFVAGPRQCGKTTVGKLLLAEAVEGVYANWDEKDFRRNWTKSPSQWIEHHLGNLKAPKAPPLIVLDELHKARGWKRDLKGIYDTYGDHTEILVTGSARLDIYKRGSDSLLGRYFLFHLHPLSLGEIILREYPSPSNLMEKIYDRPTITKEDVEVYHTLLKFGGFPEPYTKQSERFHRLWERGRTEKIIREDLRDLSRLPELSQIEMLVSLLPERAAQLLSKQSLREDLEVAHTTVTRWLNYLSQLYYLFTIRPYSKKIVRSLKREPKLYLWDWSDIHVEGPRFESMLASHLLKACQSWTDLGYGKFGLFYIRNKQKEEVDFLVTQENTPWLLIEAKLSETSPSKPLNKFRKELGLPFAVQVVSNLGRDIPSPREHGNDLIILPAAGFLQLLP